MMMSPAKRQREFLPLFVFLLVVDCFATFIMEFGGEEFAPLLMLWFGPIDDVFYALAGLQAVYFLLDPQGHTRSPQGTMGSLETVKTSASLMSQARSDAFSTGFYNGGQRALAVLSGLTLVALVSNAIFGLPFLSSVCTVAQRHLLFLLPVSLLLGLAVRMLWSAGAPKPWMVSLGGALGVLLVSMAADGRWDNHLRHLFLSIESLQAWGAALCWIGAGARAASGPHAAPDDPWEAPDETEFSE